LLTNEQNGVTQKATSNSAGDFVFLSVLPGQYKVAIQAPGFKMLEKTGLALTAAERLSAGTLVLDVGNVGESVSVTSGATPVQVASAERSALVSDKQLAALPAQGRDFMALLRTLPGTVFEGSGSQTLGQANAGTINGGGQRYVSINLDGVTANTPSPNLDRRLFTAPPTITSATSSSTPTASSTI
jgi:Carboxypeptidase regulatory-like domain